jgi:hypothetical protein
MTLPYKDGGKFMNNQRQPGGKKRPSAVLPFFFVHHLYR